MTADDPAAEPWPEVDARIFNGEIMRALILIRERYACGIPAAIDHLADRYERLRVEEPDRFTVSREDFGRGFYS